MSTTYLGDIDVILNDTLSHAWTLSYIKVMCLNGLISNGYDSWSHCNMLGMYELTKQTST